MNINRGTGEEKQVPSSRLTNGMFIFNHKRNNGENRRWKHWRYSNSLIADARAAHGEVLSWALRSTAFSAARQPASFESAHRVQRIVQSFETGKTLEIITSNHQPDLPQPSTAPVPERHCCQRPSRLRGNRAGGAVMVGGATAVGGARRWEGQCWLALPLRWAGNVDGRDGDDWRGRGGGRGLGGGRGAKLIPAGERPLAGPRRESTPCRRGGEERR